MGDLLTPTDDDRERLRARRQLEKFGVPLGTLVRNTSRAPKLDGLMSTHELGQILMCSACTKVVGLQQFFTPGHYPPRYDNKHILLDPDAGFVLERQRLLGFAWVCGPHAAPHCACCMGSGGNCANPAIVEHPFACSDACENRLLVDNRFVYCPPPFGYQRGGPHQ